MPIIELLTRIGIPPPVGVILLTGFLVFMVKFIFRTEKPADKAKTAAVPHTSASGITHAAAPAHNDAQIIAAISAAVNEYRKQK